jgi:hypothetical protein
MGFRFHIPDRMDQRSLSTSRWDPCLPPWASMATSRPTARPTTRIWCAVQAIWDAKWGNPASIRKRRPRRLQGAPEPRPLVNKTPAWCLEATKALCEYIWDTYGRFPATIDPMEMNIWFQAHHLRPTSTTSTTSPAPTPVREEAHAAWHGAQ